MGKGEVKTVDKRFKKWIETHYPQYLRYIKSNKWASIKKRVLARDHQKCVKCGTNKDLEVHHLTYEHLYKEENYLYELITLCKKCHEKETNKGKQVYSKYKEITSKQYIEKQEYLKERGRKINELDSIIKQMRKKLLRRKNIEDFEIIIQELQAINEKCKELGWLDE